MYFDNNNTSDDDDDDDYSSSDTNSSCDCAKPSEYFIERPKWKPKPITVEQYLALDMRRGLQHITTFPAALQEIKNVLLEMKLGLDKEASKLLVQDVLYALDNCPMLEACHKAVDRLYVYGAWKKKWKQNDVKAVERAYKQHKIRRQRAKKGQNPDGDDDYDDDNAVPEPVTVYNIPKECLELVFKHLNNPIHFCKAACVSKEWKQIAYNNSLWRPLFIATFDDETNHSEITTEMLDTRAVTCFRYKANAGWGDNPAWTFLLWRRQRSLAWPRKYANYMVGPAPQWLFDDEEKLSVVFQHVAEWRESENVPSELAKIVEKHKKKGNLMSGNGGVKFWLEGPPKTMYCKDSTTELPDILGAGDWVRPKWAEDDEFDDEYGDNGIGKISIRGGGASGSGGGGSKFWNIEGSR